MGLALSFFLTWDHLSKNTCSNSTSESVFILSWLRDYHHMEASSHKLKCTQFLHDSYQLNFLSSRYSSILGPSSFSINFISIIKTPKIELTLKWRIWSWKFEMTTTQSLLLKIAIITSFQNQNNHSTSTYETINKLWALYQ